MPGKRFGISVQQDGLDFTLSPPPETNFWAVKARWDRSLPGRFDMCSDMGRAEGPRQAPRGPAVRTGSAHAAVWPVGSVARSINPMVNVPISWRLYQRPRGIRVVGSWKREAQQSGCKPSVTHGDAGKVDEGLVRQGRAIVSQ